MAWQGWQGDRTPGWIVRKVRARRYCEQCGADCHVTGGQVDHIIGRAEDGSLDDLANFQLLCTDCHRDKTKAEHRRGQQRRSARGRYDPGDHPAYL